jgi:hypothetical protein
MIKARWLAVLVGSGIACLSMAGCADERAQAEAVQKVVAVHHQIVTDLSDYRSRHEEPEAAWAKAIAAMKTSDLSNCPRDFKVAYSDHLNAWRQAGPAGVDAAISLLSNAPVQPASLAPPGGIDAPALADLGHPVEAGDQPELRETCLRVQMVALRYAGPGE